MIQTLQFVAMAIIANVANLRWGDEVPTDPGAARQRMVDAAAACIDRYGLTKTTVEDVANEAKVSRATIYRYFRNRDELMLEVLLNELARSMDQPVASFFEAVTSPQDLAEAIVDVAAAVLTAIRNDDKLHHLLERDSPGFSATISGASRALFTTAADELVPPLAAARQQGFVRADIDLEEAAEWILRSILSLLIIEGPTTHSPDDERRLLQRFLVPVIVDLTPTPLTH